LMESNLAVSPRAGCRRKAATAPLDRNISSKGTVDRRSILARSPSPCARMRSRWHCVRTDSSLTGLVWSAACISTTHELMTSLMTCNPVSYGHRRQWRSESSNSMNRSFSRKSIFLIGSRIRHVSTNQRSGSVVISFSCACYLSRWTESSRGPCFETISHPKTRGLCKIQQVCHALFKDDVGCNLDMGSSDWQGRFGKSSPSFWRLVTRILSGRKPLNSC